MRYSPNVMSFASRLARVWVGDQEVVVVLLHLVSIRCSDDKRECTSIVLFVVLIIAYPDGVGLGCSCRVTNGRRRIGGGGGGLCSPSASTVSSSGSSTASVLAHTASYAPASLSCSLSWQLTGVSMCGGYSPAAVSTSPVTGLCFPISFFSISLPSLLPG